MNLSPLMIFPVLFPIVSGMALMFFRPGTDEHRHRYETFVVLMNALLVFVWLCPSAWMSYPKPSPLWPR